MKKTQKWNHRLDQWLEDKVWTKVPEEYATPHMFFMLGASATISLIVVTTILIKIIL